MLRIKTFAAVAALGVGAGACTTAPDTISAGNNPSLYSVHQPVVQRTDFVIDLQTQGDGVPASEIERLHAWFDSIELRYGDRISVDEPGGYASPGARADVAAALGEYGLLLSDGAPITRGSVAPGTIRIVASRATASVPGCPNWDERTEFPNSNTSPNYGCATNSNLAAMVANPEDLIRGQDGTIAGSAVTAGRAIRTYRERAPSGRDGLPAATTTRTTGNR